MKKSNRRRVLVIVSSLAVGGPQRSLIGLLRNVDCQRFDVTLAVLNPGRAAMASSLPAHVRVLKTPKTVTAATLPRERFLRSISSVLLLLPVHKQAMLIGFLLRGLFMGLGWQQVRQHVWCLTSPYLPKIPGEYEASVGILGSSTYAVVDLVSADNKFHWVRSDSRILGRDEDIEDKYFAQLSGALAVSQQCAELYSTIYPRMRGRIHVYKNDTRTVLSGVDAGIAWPVDNSGASRILTIARLDPLKGIDLAIDACHMLRDRGYRLCWLVLGDGPQRKSLQSQISRNGLDECFTLVGTVMNVESYLAAADIYVHPSLAEGRSNAVEEARAAGKAIVATRYPTVTDQVTEGIDGLVSEVTAKSLADTIERVLVDPVLAKTLGFEAARRHASDLGDPNGLLELLTTRISQSDRA